VCARACWRSRICDLCVHVFVRLVYRRMRVCIMSRQLMGFKEVRLVPSRPGIGFAEFENEMQSGMAMSQLQGYKMGDKAFKITFSKS